MRAVVVRLPTIDHHGLVTVPEKPAPQTVAHVEASGVGVLQPAHASDQVGLGCFDEQVIVVGHERPGVDAPPGARTGLGQGVQEEATVVIIEKNRLPPVPTGHDVVEGTREFQAKTARHESTMIR